MPGVLLLESLVQLAGWLEAQSSGFKNWFLINKVRKCGFYGFSLPGDQVKLEVQLLSQEQASPNIYKGTGIVEGKKKIAAEFEGEIVPLGHIEDINEHKNLFQILTRRG
jgi:3-hydroxymyristoyl/3-hydroxydecanoyl-(acyl carrier protein) dehydratase